MMTGIERELHLLSTQGFPDFHERLMCVRQAIQDGKIDGAMHGGRGSPCRCFYGHFTGEHLEQSIQLAEKMRKLTRALLYTSIEHLVTPVRPGETPETNVRLAELLEAMQPYVEQERKEEVLV